MYFALPPLTSYYRRWWSVFANAFAHMILKAMVVERNDFWFMDDGALTYHICEVKTKIRDKKNIFEVKTDEYIAGNT